MENDYRLSSNDLDCLFREKYGSPETTGWSPKRRYKYGYFSASDIYEAILCKLINESTEWIDVGGGSAIFPNNVHSSTRLADKCKLLVAVDPSSNVQKNPYCDEFGVCMFEDYETEKTFNLATFRMVAEHIESPSSVLEKLQKLIKPGGLVVIYTINKYCPIPIVTRYTPFSMHYKIKKILWGGEEEDTFPVAYKMNTRKTLDKLFSDHGFVEDHFQYVDDLSMFGKFNFLSHMELALWKILNSVNVSYPENNLLGIYRKIS